MCLTCEKESGNFLYCVSCLRLKKNSVCKCGKFYDKLNNKYNMCFECNKQLKNNSCLCGKKFNSKNGIYKYCFECFNNKKLKELNENKFID